MSKRSKFLVKLIEASGGWEQFLYITLKELCDVLPTIDESTDTLEEAREILEAYEELGKKDQPNQLIPTPQFQKAVENDKGNTVKNVASNGLEPVADLQEPEIDEPVEIKLEDLIFTPPPRVTPESVRRTGRVNIDKDLGGSSGELPISANYKMVDMRSISITTTSNLELGRGSDKNGQVGQIVGQYVSGHVSASGRYRLVFKDNTLGTGLIHYEVISLPIKMTKKQFIEGVAVQNKLDSKRLYVILHQFEKVVIPCSCGREDCFGWRVVDQAEIDEAEAQRKGRIAAIHNEQIVGGK